MTNPIPYLIQGNNIILVVDNKPHTINDTHLSYSRIKDAIRNKDWGVISDLVYASKALKGYTQNRFEVVDGEFYRDGVAIHNAIATRIVSMYQEGFDVNPLINFMNNLDDNPSARAVNELYGFIEKSNLPITEDGCFLAYKAVRDSYFDVYSGTVLNKPANLLTAAELKSLPTVTKDENEVTVDVVNGETVVSMKRNKVNDNKDQTCSYGLHFCSLDYLQYFKGDRIVILKINPKDVVSIPSDYRDTKGRCCAYTVVGEVDDTKQPQKYFDSTLVDTKHSSKGYRKNSKGQWIDASGHFLPKHLIPTI